MTLKPIALAVGSLALILCLLERSCDQADSDLSTFYSQMFSADFSSARRSIDDAIRRWPTNARYYGWRGYVTSQNLPPTCPRGSRKSGPRLRVEEQVAARQAIDDYRRASELNRHDAVAHHNLAWLEHLLGEDKVAAENWEAAVAIDPGNAVLHLSRGMFLQEMGDKQEANKEYEAAIELSPSILDSPFFTRYKTRSKDAADRLVEELREKLERKLQQGPDPILEARLGKLCLFCGDLARASKLLEEASRQLPNLPLVWLNLGEVYERQNRLAEAMDCYQKAKVIDSFLAGPYLRMGEIEFRNGEKTTATESFMQAIQRWERVTPITAAHNNRLYVGPRQSIDDLLPTTLVWYTTPCEASQAWVGLSRLYPTRRDYVERVRTCEQLPSPHPF
jgi:tetratricopeptide (TPR) repeat protein